ncbi:NifB/NifX family molybdenum-iron cluster-binding protein [Geobacter sp. AOG2]|uniref:NifB/NifX family molybdenum-iron cluster-binding protein n=1 Tax=Geobacter sp. AOG2 TaxID=1566347 RepID=UPI001CC44783|nr:NifB/NifX family molybdenum-iron cluster-binding protein [Geobacter sp. AOG2]GFE61659.1 nitrogen fixation protein NifX [Geobacter sp. AOG2]
MKVAFTTSTGVEIDQNFRKSTSFTVWDIGPDEAYYVTTVRIDDDGGNEDDRIAARVTALKGCSIVCAGEINGPAAAKLVAKHIHPMKFSMGSSVEEVIGRLKNVLRGTPAPWMRKTQIADISDDEWDCVVCR